MREKILLHTRTVVIMRARTGLIYGFGEDEIAQGITP